MKRVSFYTLGCKVNQYETNGMMQKFKEARYEIVDMNADISDICVVNTYGKLWTNSLSLFISTPSSTLTKVNNGTTTLNTTLEGVTSGMLYSTL